MDYMIFKLKKSYRLQL